MGERNDQLKNLIQNGQIDRAIEMIRDTKDYGEGESFAFTVLGECKSTPELVEAVLEAFLKAKPDYAAGHYGGGHGGWVHSLSHFTEILWERRMDSWIKKFNEVAFKGANELGDSNCSDRLVYDFGKYAKFNDDPVDFGLTPENLVWMEWNTHTAYTKARIEAGRFESEEAFIRWKLHQPKTRTTFDYDAQIDLVDIKGIRTLIQQLKELNANTGEFDDLEKGLLTKQLSELEGKLSTEMRDWAREGLEKGIQKTRAALA